MSTIKAPFSKEQVLKLNEYQKAGKYHPFTCSRESHKCEVNIIPRDFSKDGVLIATEEGFVCPCGVYKQDWCHSFMAE